MNKILFIGIHPKFTGLFLDGTKTVELRKSKPNVKKGDIVVLYATAPQKEIVALAKIESVLKLPVGVLWRRKGNLTGVEYKYFNEYYKNKAAGVAITMEDVEILTPAITLKQFKERVPRIKMLQGYQYLTDSEFKNLIGQTNE